MIARRTAGPAVSLRNLQRKTRIDLAEMQNFAERALRACIAYSRTCGVRLRRLSEVSILLVSDRRMSALHRRFLNAPGPTDVLTFDYGEIFISVETAGTNALRFNSSVSREIRLYIIHGLLHLCGFDDRIESAAHDMDEAQRQILAATAQ